MVNVIGAEGGFMTATWVSSQQRELYCVPPQVDVLNGKYYHYHGVYQGLAPVVRCNPLSFYTVRDSGSFFSGHRKRTFTQNIHSSWAGWRSWLTRELAPMYEFVCHSYGTSQLSMPLDSNFWTKGRRILSLAHYHEMFWTCKLNLINYHSIHVTIRHGNCRNVSTQWYHRLVQYRRSTSCWMGTFDLLIEMQHCLMHLLKRKILC